MRVGDHEEELVSEPDRVHRTVALGPVVHGKFGEMGKERVRSYEYETYVNLPYNPTLRWSARTNDGETNGPRGNAVSSSILESSTEEIFLQGLEVD